MLSKCWPVNSSQALSLSFFLFKNGIPHIKIQPSSRNGQDGSENMIVQPKRWYIGGCWENRKRSLPVNKLMKDKQRSEAAYTSTGTFQMTNHHDDT